jgi:hypothetical protein
MESVWRRYRDLFVEPNRQKWDADWAVHTADMAEAVQLMWRSNGDVVPADVAGDVADFDWLMVVESFHDTWHLFG